MKLSKWVRGISAAAGALVLALGVAMGAVAQFESAPPLQKQVIIEDNLDPLASTSPGSIEAATLSYTNSSGEAQTTDLLNASTVDLPSNVDATLHLVVDTSQVRDAKVAITIPKGMVLVAYPKKDAMPALVESVDVSGLGTNTYGGYTPQFGTLVYHVTDITPKLVLELVVKIDTPLVCGLGDLDEERTNEATQTLGDPLTVKVYSGSADASPLSSFETNVVVATGAVVGYFNISNAVSYTPIATGESNSFSLASLRFVKLGYFKKVQITVAVPYDETKQVYAKFAKLTYPNVSTSTNVLNPDINKNCTFSFSEDTANHTITLTWENIYLDAYDYITPCFYWDADNAPEAGDNIVWFSHSIPKKSPESDEDTTVDDADDPCFGGATYITEDNVEHALQNSYTSKSFCPTYQYTKPLETITATGASSIVLTHTNGGDTNLSHLNPDLVYYLGCVYLNNAGAQSPAQTIEYEYKNTDKIHVTAQAIPTAAGNKVTVRFKTNKRTDWVEHPTTLTSDNGYKILFTAEMAGLGEGEYFTWLQADIGSLPTGYRSDPMLTMNQPQYGGAFFGTLTAAATSNATTQKSYATAVCKTYNTDDMTQSSPAKTANFKVYPDGSLMAAMGFVPDKDSSGAPVSTLSADSVVAGRTVHVSGLASTAENSPGTGNAYVYDPSIYVRLPEGVTMKNLVLEKVVGDRDNEIYQAEGFEGERNTSGNPVSSPLSEGADYTVGDPVALPNGYTVREISFSAGKGALGWFNSDISETQIRISFDLAFDSSMGAGALNLRHSLFVRSNTFVSYHGGGYVSRYAITDEFGILAAMGASSGAVGANDPDSSEQTEGEDQTNGADGSDEGGQGGDDENVGYLSTFSTTNPHTMLVIQAARGGNAPVVSVGLNGGTAKAGTQALMIVGEDGMITLPEAPICEGKEFDGWVCSNAACAICGTHSSALLAETGAKARWTEVLVRAVALAVSEEPAPLLANTGDGDSTYTYHAPGEMIKATDNLAVAAAWKGETPPTPDATDPFAYAVNESGTNYGGSANDMNADDTGTVPPEIAERAGGPAGGIDGNGGGTTPGNESGSGDGTTPDDGTGGDNGPGGDATSGNGPDSGDGSTPGGGAAPVDGADGPGGGTTPGNGPGSSDGTTPGDGTGGVDAITGGQSGSDTNGPQGGSGGSAGTGATAITNAGSNSTPYTPLVQTGDALPLIIFACVAGAALVVAIVAFFRRRGASEELD